MRLTDGLCLRLAVRRSPRQLPVLCRRHEGACGSHTARHPTAKATGAAMKVQAPQPGCPFLRWKHACCTLRVVRCMSYVAWCPLHVACTCRRSFGLTRSTRPHSLQSKRRCSTWHTAHTRATERTYERMRTRAPKIRTHALSLPFTHNCARTIPRATLGTGCSCSKLCCSKRSHRSPPHSSLFRSACRPLGRSHSAPFTSVHSTPLPRYILPQLPRYILPQLPRYILPRFLLPRYPAGACAASSPTR